MVKGGLRASTASSGLGDRRSALRVELNPLGDDYPVDDNLRNCRNCRWKKLNLPAMPAVVWNCVHPHTLAPIGPLNVRIDDWIDANVDDFDETGMPTHARNCPGWTP